MTWKRGHTLDVLDEEHHRIYGSKWALGLDQKQFLISRGLAPHHHLLDLGCGAGRAGTKLIPYLDPGHYVGIDGHVSSLSAFERYEIPLHSLEARQPRLLVHNIETTPLPFDDASFDAVLAFSVFDHLADPMSAARHVARVLRPGGLLFAAIGPPRRPADAGFALEETVTLRSILVPDKEISWFVYVRLTAARSKAF
jgi:SAM-dependent methyltransferase